MSERPTEQVMIRVTPSMREALEQEAEATERTMSGVVRLAIRRFLAAEQMAMTRQVIGADR